MIKIFPKINAILIGFCLFSSSLAARQDQVPPVIRDIKFGNDACPTVDLLKQNPNATWGAPNGWRSMTPSFLKSIQQFAGAQWAGVNFGEIICIYVTGSKYDFPVQMHRPSTVVFSPVGGNWSKDKGGYKDCQANDPTLCAFLVAIPTTPTNIYDELEQFKSPNPAPEK